MCAYEHTRTIINCTIIVACICNDRASKERPNSHAALQQNSFQLKDVCSYIPRYPVGWTAQCALHFINGRLVHSYTNSISLESIQQQQLSDVRRQVENEIDQASKRQLGGFETWPPSIESAALYRWGTAFHVFRPTYLYVGVGLRYSPYSRIFQIVITACNLYWNIVW